MAPPLPKKSEWDFRNVQDSEVIACFHYEFAREVPELVARTEKLRGTSEIRSFERILELNRQFGSFSSYVLGNYRFFLWYPEWPQTPYLKIDETTRRARIKILTHRHKPSDKELVGRLRPLPPPTYLEGAVGSKAEGWAKADGTKIEIVIRPWFTRDELKEAFAALLRVDFPQHGKASGNRSRPQGRAGGLAPYRQDLQALGIHRLLNKMKAREVLTFFESVKDPLHLSEESALRRLRVQARKAITKFESNALLHLDNNPAALMASLVCA
jgi:hypothetical protein